MTAETEQLEVQIAEALGLWKPGTICEANIYQDSSGNPICPSCDIWEGLGEPAYGTDHEVPCPAYSTDIAAAFQVVESMRERGWDIDLIWRAKSAPNKAVYVKFSRPRERITNDDESAYLQIAAGADTPALAIVRAALAALKAEEGGDGD